MDYETMTKEQFKKLNADELHDPVLIWTSKFNPYMDLDAFNSAHDSIKVAVIVMMMHGEVLNGGFNQFICNGMHDLGFELYKEVYGIIGCAEVVALIKQLEQIYKANKGNLLNDRSAFESEQASIEAFSKSYENDPFEEITEKYAEIQCEIEEKLFAYIMENIEHFGD
ncbi:MAG: DMP19 family protein [Firmicutes bacterium]|nr:DMP19 family protein [Bacillota bacterium]